MHIKNIWWLNPIYVLLFFLSLCVGAYSVDASTYVSLYKTEKGIDSITLLLYFLCIFFIGIGIFLKNKINIKINNIEKFEKISKKTFKLLRPFRVLYGICIVAYFIWFTNTLLVHGNIIFSILSNFSSLSEYSGILFFESTRVSGLTTFTELGPLIISLGIYIFFNTNDKNIKKYISKRIVFLMIVILIRAFLFSERVAFISCLLPIIVQYILYRTDITKNKIIKIFPVIGIILLFILFGIFEYFRSWPYYENMYNSYFQFIYERIMGYYYCAINTESLYLNHMGPSYSPVLTFSWFYRLPIISELELDNWGKNFFEILSIYGNPEFNNMGGILAIYNDYGILSPLVYIFFGIILGYMYKIFINNTALGIIVYPYTYYSLLELPRFFAFGNLHYFFFLIGTLMMIIFVNYKIK